jgi:hypothetical protein
VEGKKRNRLNGGTAVGNRQQRQLDYRQEEENQYRERQVEMRRRGSDGARPQEQCEADQNRECARAPKVPHDSIVSDPPTRGVRFNPPALFILGIGAREPRNRTFIILHYASGISD